MQSKTFIIDPGHGMSNRKSGQYDPGACFADYTEADIAMDWSNELRRILMARGHRVIRTRIDRYDPCPVSRRDDIARSYEGFRMISIHLNSTPGASGTETFYRGEDDRGMALRLTSGLCSVLGTKNRGPKTENQSQHKSLAVLEFDKCWLVELGFIDSFHDRTKLLNAEMRRKGCEAMADALTHDL